MCLALILGCSSEPATQALPESGSEHAVIVTLQLSDSEFGTTEERAAIFDLETKLEATIADRGVGEYDGHEIGEGKYTLYMYGANADALFEIVEPILRETSLLDGGNAVKRYGDAADPSAEGIVVNF